MVKQFVEQLLRVAQWSQTCGHPGVERRGDFVLVIIKVTFDNFFFSLIANKWSELVDNF